MRILFSDSRWLVVSKPPGLPTHAGAPGQLGVQEHLTLYGHGPLYVVSRLDVQTSGVLVFARTPEASGDAERIHTGDSALKRYVCVSHAPPPRGPGPWTVQESLDGKPACTVFSFTGTTPHGFQYEAFLARGRRHQVRRHGAHLGIPLLGDRAYGGQSFPRVALHCAEVQWPGYSTWTSPLPLSFGEAPALPHATALTTAVDRRDWGGTSPRRLLHRREWPTSDVTIDRYGDTLVGLLYDDEPDLALAKDLLQFFLAREGLPNGVLRRPGGPPLEVTGLPGPQWVEEDGLWFPVDPSQATHPGLFLDTRDARRTVRLLAQGARVLNLFSYTCSFSASALAGGAQCVVSADVSRAALGAGRRACERNGLPLDRARFYARDARKVLASSSPQSWDLIVVDPPTFARSSPPFHLSRDWPELVLGAARALAPRGKVLFCHNHQEPPESAYGDPLRAAFEEVIPHQPPLDFPPCAPSNHLYWACRPRPEVIR